MADKVEPAIGERDWRQFINGNSLFPNSEANQEMPRYLKQCDHPSFIAKHNYLLPDSDPRKFVRNNVDILRGTVEALRSGDTIYHIEKLTAELERIADAIESYLPPVT